MFKIPLPCKMGEETEYKNAKYKLCGVEWFFWNGRGWEFTYHIANKTDASWNNTLHILSEKDTTVSSYINIKESLLDDKPIKEHGYPLTGSGHLYGFKFIKGKLYAEFIITNRYYEHILCECDETGQYNGGMILFPPTPSYDSEEKRMKAVTASYLKTHTA